MKIIKEDIANLERYIGDNKVDIHAELPLIMADAYEESKKRQEEIDKEFKDDDKEVEVESKDYKVIGAEDQPVPDMPVEAKITLEESLFEDYRDKNWKIVEKVEAYIDEGHINKDDLIDKLLQWYYLDPTFKSFFITNKILSEEEIDDLLEEEILKENKLPFKIIVEGNWKYNLPISHTFDEFDEWDIEDIHQVGFETEDIAKYETNTDADYFVLTFKDGTKKAWFIHSGMYIEDDAFKECLKEDTAEDKYYAALDIPKGPERRKVAAERRQEFLRKYDLEDRAQEWKDAKGKDDPEEEEDLFTKIQDELFPYDMEEVKLWTKLPEVPASKRYHQGDIGVDYDGNILVYASEDEDFDFARKVASAYDLEITDPRQQGKYKVTVIKIPEE